MDLIYENSKNGKIYQCGADEIPGTMGAFGIHRFAHDWWYDYAYPPEKQAIHDNIAAELAIKGIDLLVLTALEYQPPIAVLRGEVIHVPFNDTVFSRDGLKELEDFIVPVADRMAQVLENGGSVLSTCFAGINRSSLLTGLCLKKATNLSPKEIIKIIRENRFSYCLRNEQFAELLLNGFPK